MTFDLMSDISVLTTCTFMFQQVCTIEPSFFNTTSGIYHRPFEGRHLVLIVIYFLKQLPSFKNYTKGLCINSVP